MGGVHLYGAVVTALYRRQQTGKGGVVEVAMQEALYPSLASDLGIRHREGAQQPRRGNRHDGVAPYNVYETADGHVAMICITEGHWQAVLEVTNRQDARSDPRFENHLTRAEHVDAVDELVADWTRSRPRDRVVELAQAAGIPCAPVRDLDEVVNDRHMHERGMLHQFAHRELGEVVLPSSPLRFHGDGQVEPTNHPQLGEHNREIYSEWLGLSEQEIERLCDEGVI